jgi:hypothetical protein
LDTSLLAAVLADIEQGPDGKLLLPSSAQIQSLRADLRKLADQASEHVEQQLSDELAGVHLSSHASTTDSTPEFYAGDTTSSGSNSSGSSQHPFSSPLGFLQAALPHIPTSRLREALDDAGGDAEDVDMELVVETLLTSEYVKELEERGISGPDAVDQEVGMSMGESVSWETVEVKKKKKKPPSSFVSTSPKRKATRGKPIRLVDIRQKQHIRSSSFNDLPAPDPWSQMTSLASHVASMLPPHEPSVFLSFFHNPDYPSPSAALRAAITSLSEPHSEHINTDILFNLLDILRANPMYDTLDLERKSLLVSDARLSLTAASGRGDDALDLVWLLHELEEDGERNLEMGVYHNPPFTPPAASPWTSFPSPSIAHSPKLFSPAPLRARSKSPSHVKSNPQAFQWESVPIRKPPRTYPHSAYSPFTNPSNTRRAWGGNALGKGGKGNVGELQQRSRMKERNELLRQAAGAWKSGNKKKRGGEIAAYYAERAKDVQEIARKEQLERARDMVEAKRYRVFTSI